MSVATGATPSTAPLLEASGIGKRFGGFQVLDDVSFAVPPARPDRHRRHQRRRQEHPVRGGQRPAARPMRGRVRFDGSRHRQPLAGATGPARSRPHVPGAARVRPPDRARELPRRGADATTARRCARCSSAGAGSLARSARSAKRADRWIEFLNLRAVADNAAGDLSGGQKKLLELGRMLMLEPKCILLDEPFAGVNPVLIDEISTRIRELNDATASPSSSSSTTSRRCGRWRGTSTSWTRAGSSPTAIRQRCWPSPRVHEAYMGGVI